MQLIVFTGFVSLGYAQNPPALNETKGVEFISRREPIVFQFPAGREKNEENTPWQGSREIFVDIIEPAKIQQE